MDLQYIINLFGRWYNGETVSATEERYIILAIVLCVTILLIMLIWMAHLGRWGTRIKWFFEDICHWLGWNIGSYKEKDE